MADEKTDNHDSNPDPITGAPGSHPLGTGVGAAGGAAAGATIGAAGGPIGAAVGTVVGALAGALAGKEAAEAVSPTNPAAKAALTHFFGRLVRVTGAARLRFA